MSPRLDLSKRQLRFSVRYRRARLLLTLPTDPPRLEAGLRLPAILALLAGPASHCFALSPPVLHSDGARGDGLPGRAHGSAHPRLVGPLVGRWGSGGRWLRPLSATHPPHRPASRARTH